MKVFITGANGFIGSYVCEYLLAKGYQVIASRRQTSNLDRCVSIKDTINWVYVDSDGWVEKVIALKPNIIINLAWIGVEAAMRSDWNSQIINIEFQQTLLNIAKATDVKVFIGAGSQSEYGAFCRVIDEDEPANPVTAYGAVKLASLDILKSFCNLNAITWYWFRIFPCYGERESDNWLIPSLIKQMIVGSSMELTKGEQELAYLYVREVAKVFAESVECKAPCGIYNISSNKVMPLRKMVEKIRDYVNPNFKLIFGALPYRQGQSMHMEGKNEKTCKYIYNIDSEHFDENMIKTINYYKEIYKNE